MKLTNLAIPVAIATATPPFRQNFLSTPYNFHEDIGPADRMRPNCYACGTMTTPLYRCYSIIDKDIMIYHKAKTPTLPAFSKQYLGSKYSLLADEGPEELVRPRDGPCEEMVEPMEKCFSIFEGEIYLYERQGAGSAANRSRRV